MSQEKPPFSSLARVYDAIFADVEYDDWADFALTTLADLGWLESREGTTLLDLACGTGNSLEPYIEIGLNVTGVDASREMIAVAQEKFPDHKFFQQGFLELDLGKRYQIITCVFDSLNNLLEFSDLVETFKRIKTHLEPNGAFVFDCNTPLGVTDLWEDNEFSGVVKLSNGSAHFHWTHQVQSDTIGEITAHIWLMDDQGALQEEFHEIHLERGYTALELESALQQAGFLEIHLMEYPDGAEVTEETPRFWGFAR